MAMLCEWRYGGAEMQSDYDNDFTLMELEGYVPKYQARNNGAYGFSDRDMHLNADADKGDYAQYATPSGSECGEDDYGSWPDAKKHTGLDLRQLRPEARRVVEQPLPVLVVTPGFVMDNGERLDGTVDDCLPIDHPVGPDGALIAPMGTARPGPFKPIVKGPPSYIYRNANLFAARGSRSWRTSGNDTTHVPLKAPLIRRPATTEDGQKLLEAALEGNWTSITQRCEDSS